MPVGYVGVNDPQYFDWVKARARCSAREMFDRLREVVAADVESANRDLANRGARFRLDPAESGKVFTVVRLVHNPPDTPVDARRFNLDGDEITVTDMRSRPVIAAQAALVEDGDPPECLLEVQGHERPMRLWRFSRLVLTRLFFVD